MFMRQSKVKINLKKHRWVWFGNFASVVETDLSNLHISMLVELLIKNSLRDMV